MLLNKIYNLLKGNGIDVYFPNQHKGECLSPYVVVKNNGAIELSISSERPLYNIMCYVPEKNYSILEEYADDIKKLLQLLYPTIDYTGNRTPSYYDSEVKGHMISFDVMGIKKINKS